MHPSSTTIAAISTAAGGGVGVIRVSGPQATRICSQVCSPARAPLLSHHLYFGQVLDPEAEEVIDQVLFCMMYAPRSYTGEDVLEIHAHGGKINLQRVLGAVLRAGARIAEPGEFTKRSFMNGKTDLTKVEALVDLIGAQTVRAARQAQRQLAGNVGTALQELKKIITRLLGQFEGAIDFPDIAFGATSCCVESSDYKDALYTEVDEVIGRLEDLAASFWKGGKALHSGLEMAFVGQTNAGKSSLINSLCLSERLLVNDQPGTTRDYVEVRTEWEGISVLLVDTAGLRADANDVERLGIYLGRERWSRVDLLVLVVDGIMGMSPQEERLLQDESGRCIVAWNKVDQVGCRVPPPGEKFIPCSALCGWGLEGLKQAALNFLAPHIGEEEELVITNERQAQLLSQAAGYMYKVRNSLRGGLSNDLAAADLRTAIDVLAEIIGQVVTTADSPVIESIFAQLCIGK